ncbi:MAG: 4-hydroxy-tetrahydrodipicolinate synthase [Porticoccus sp.]|jgi:4-hydroxy-tetrahydrodipicolinate synthase|nr:4-hydroxy-tetrahydrodipicolinate synthase [Porticoccus sp.]
MITGSIVALVTPMVPDSLEVDWVRLKSLVEWHIHQGTNAIVAVGTTGESPTLDVQEHMATIAAIVEDSSGRIPIIAGTGANSTKEAIEWTRRAQESGADACLLVAPYYNKPTQEGLYLHYKSIADAVDIPQILYNVPGRTACDMLPDTVSRLAVIENIVGIKDATGDLQRGKKLIEVCPSDFAIYSGDDATALDLILLGGHGNVSVTANLAPKLMAEMCRLARSGEKKEARKINKFLEPLHDALFLESNPIPVKWAVAEMGLIQHGIRLPLTELSSDLKVKVREAMKSAELLK